MINQLLEFCKYLGIIALIIFLFNVIIILIQTTIDGIRKRKKKLELEKQLNEDILKLIEEWTNTPKSTKKRKKDSD